MNYLAHLLLSGDNPEWQLGGFLGDFVKGPLSPAPLDNQGSPWSADVVAGITLHRAIDAHVDQHALYQQALARLGPDFRRIGGIALDITFDHLLVNHWADFSPLALDEYCQRIYNFFANQEARFPSRAAVFSERMRRFQLLQAYAESETVEQVLQRVGQRLRFANRLAESFEVIERNREGLNDDFLQLMPRLQDFARQRRYQLEVLVSQS